jgi:hypothetical protein
MWENPNVFFQKPEVEATGSKQKPTPGGHGQNFPFAMARDRKYCSRVAQELVKEARP